MATVADVVAWADHRYPPGLAEEWDTPGLSVGDPRRVVRHVRFAVDPTIAVAREAIAAGADMLFIESPESEAELAKIGKTFGSVPLVANMVEGGRTPIMDRAELERLGFKLAIFPTAGFLAAAAAMRSVYGEIRSRGSSKSWTGELYPFDDFSRLMGFERVWAFEREHAEG